MSDERRMHCRRETDADDDQCNLADYAAKQSAEIAVRKTFAILGVDIDNPREVETFRQDLRFGGMLRRAAERGFIALVTAIVLGVVAAVWVGLQVKLGGAK